MSDDQQPIPPGAFSSDSKSKSVPPQHPSIATTTSTTDQPPVSSQSANAPGTSTQRTTQNGFLKRTFSKDTRHTARRFFSAYAEAWIGLSPLWLMGEALTGQKPGTKFIKGKDNLVAAAEEVRKVVATSGKDVVVILDEKLRTRREQGASSDEGQTGRAAEVIKAAGDNAVLVVTTSLEKMQAELKQWNVGPQLQKIRAKNGRDVVVVLDKALKHPVVVTGVSNFARSKGIPHADALLRLGSLGLARILRAMPEAEAEVMEAINNQGAARDETGTKATIEEIDAAELERSSSFEENEEARTVGEQAHKVGEAEVKEGGDPYENMRKRNDCIIM